MKIVIFRILILLGVAFSSISLFTSTSAYAKQSGYAMNPSKVYVYGSRSEIDVVMNFVKNVNGYRQWEGVNRFDRILFYEKDTKKGYYYGSPNKKPTSMDLAIAYPIKKGKTWKANYWGTIRTLTIKSTNKTITTKAGKFKNVLQIRVAGEGLNYYYAKGIGYISLRSDEGEIYDELVNIYNK